MKRYYGIEFFEKNRSVCYCHQRKYLSLEEKEVYDIILKGLINCKSCITLPPIKAERVWEICDMVLDEHCYLFHVDIGKSIIYVYGETELKLEPVYLYDKEETDEKMWSLMEKITSLVGPWMRLSKTEQEKAVYQYLKSQVTYKDTHTRECYECYMPLLEGKGVCIGIAKAAKLLFDYCGFGDSMIVTGRLTRHNRQDDGDLHAWNMVCLNHKYYHLDITFDLNGGKRHYNLTDDQIKKDRKILTEKLPACTTRWNERSFIWSI